MEATQSSESPLAALRDAVACAGSQSALSRILGVTQATVSNWLSKRQPLPAEHVLTVERATGIPRSRLRPDIYPVESPSKGPDIDPPADHPAALPAAAANRPCDPPGKVQLGEPVR